MLPPAAIITWLFLCIETLNEIHLNMAIAWLPGFRWEAKEPGACGWPVFSHKSIFPPARSWGARDGAQMWACACESVVSKYIVLHAFMLPSTKRHTVPSLQLAQSFLFLLFSKYGFHPQIWSFSCPTGHPLALLQA